MKIYRIENEETYHGMWYQLDGTYNPFIFNLTEGKSRNLPMGYHERYSKGGLKWFSGCGDKETMQHWFSNKDAVELFQCGYRLYEFESEQFVVEENQILFTREGVNLKREIPLNTLWDVDKDNRNLIIIGG